MIKNVIKISVLLLLLTSMSCSLQTVELTINGNVLTVELAVSKDEQMTGLMNREELDPDKGMLFVYTEDRPMNFWMKNTLIPLDIAYIDSKGRIREIYTMKPLSKKTVSSKRLLRFALEVNAGYFAEHGITEGDYVDGLLELPILQTIQN